MTNLRKLALPFIFVITTLGASGCVAFSVEDDATATCNGFDSFLATCYPSCAADWDCVYYYDGLDYNTQILLDECSDCLYANAGTCTDCIAGSEYCMDLLSAYLGMSCVY